MYRDTDRFNCGVCAKTPRTLELYGFCGTRRSRHPLDLKIGAPVRRCPVALGQGDPLVELFALMVPSPAGPGTLAGIPMMQLPPRFRDMVRIASSWLAAYRMNEDTTRQLQLIQIARKA